MTIAAGRPAILPSTPPCLFFTGCGQIDAARRQMLHQPEEERQVAFGDALFVERENEIAGAGVHQKIGILDALGDALVGEQFADVVAGEKAGEIFRRDVGIDRHEASLRRLVLPQRAGQREEHPLLRRRDGFDVECVALGKGVDDFLDQNFGRGGTGGDAEPH